MLRPGVLVVELRQDGGRGRARGRGGLARGRQVGVRPVVRCCPVGPVVPVRRRRRGGGCGARGRGEPVGPRGRRRGGGGGRIVRGRAGRVTRVAGDQAWKVWTTSL